MRAGVTTLIMVLLVGVQLAAAEFGREESEGDSFAVVPKTANSEKSSVALEQQKDYWLSAVEVTGINLGLWGYHKYLTKEGWANISWETIKSNFRTGFVWDYDAYLTNQFMHPYHGAAYFSAARSNGLEFWESAPYAFGGSLMWEYFMEDQPPSYNDIVNTPVTGIILGEISFRVANIILDESTSGSERLTRELGAFVVNPMHGFNRFLRGDMWREGSRQDHGKFVSSLSLGIDNVFLGRTIANTRSYGYLSFDFASGELLKVSEHKKPFDYFAVHTELSMTSNDNIVGIFASGVLWDGHVAMFGERKIVGGIYKEIDILINTVYKFSATAATGMLSNTFELNHRVTLQTSASVSAVLMGATNSQYTVAVWRDYNIGPGAGAKLNATLEIADIGRIYVNYRRYWIHTLNGIASEEFVGLMNIGTNYLLFSKTYLGFDVIWYDRYGVYRDFPNTQTSNAALRMYVRYCL